MAHDTEQSTPLNTIPSELSALRKDPEFRALGKKMQQYRAGRMIRIHSIIAFLAIAANTALYIGFTSKSMRDYVYRAGSSLAKFNFFYVTLATLVLPLLCRFYLSLLAATIAGQLLGERGYTASSACLLLAINLRTNLETGQYMACLRSTERGVRSVVFMRLVGDYIVNFGVPFVSLALMYRAKGDSCWIGYEWGWLLLGLLWPSLWTTALLLYTIRFWGSQEFTRPAVLSGAPAIWHAAQDLKLLVKEADGDLSSVKGKWKHGIRISEPNGPGEDGFFLGLVRESECLSWMEFYEAVQAEDETLGGKVVQSV